jgi:hypothetical protein
MSEAKFSVILEDEPIWVEVLNHGGRHLLRPVTRQLDIIDATDLEDAWAIARKKWYTDNQGKQIVDIIPGELTEPLRPGEEPIPQLTQEQTEPQEEPTEVHDG